MTNPISRFSSRAIHVLRTEGLDVLVKKIRRRLRVQVFHPLPPTLIQLPVDYIPQPLPVCGQHPRASLIIPCEGKLSQLHHCLAAISASGDKAPFEVIVVFNGSEEILTQELKSYGIHCVQSREENLRPFQSLNLGAAEARGDFLVFLTSNIQVQSGWLDALLDTFEGQQQAGLVGSRVIFPNGRQKEAGGIVFQDGSVWSYGQLDDPYQPEYSYLREPDFFTETSLAIERTLFKRLGGFDINYSSSCYGNADLAFRIRVTGYRVYYQPWSRVIDCGSNSTGQDLGVCTNKISDLDIDKHIFIDRWREKLGTHGECGKYIEQQKERYVHQRAFVVDVYVPTPDRESGSLRLVNLFTLLRELGFKVTFAATNLEAPEPYVANLQRQGVEVIYQPYTKSISRHLKSRGIDYDLVILSRADAAIKVIGPARRLCPKARLVFDTVDLHFLRERRLAELTGDPRTKSLADRRRREELGLISKADATLVVSAIEKELLAQEAPGADVRILSNIHRLPGLRYGYTERHDIFFIGSFSHPPNKDAVLWFSREILPLILAQEPEVIFFVIGADPPAEVRELASQSLRVLGHVPDVRPYFDGCRLSVAPLRYGAGVKGKINQSLAHGLPVVGTSQAIEGMFLADGHSVLLANEPSEFAAAVLRLYRDPKLWERLSSNGLAVMKEHFGFDSARRALVELLENHLDDSATLGQICAVIVAFHPDIDHLTVLVRECLKQCDGVILVNNSSHVAIKLQAPDRLRIIEVGANIGLAAAQNMGVNLASDLHFEYVIFFDQDSLPEPGSVARLRTTFAHLDASNAAPAAVGPCVVDSRDGVMTPFVRFHLWGVQHFLPYPFKPWIQCDFLIASGILTSIPRFKAIGNWEEALFIDNVDMEWSFRARSQGFRCFGVPTARLYHPLGDRLIRFRLFHRNLTIYLHASSRQYYMMRNRIALYRRGYIPLAWKAQDIPRALLKFIMFSLILGPRWKNLQSMLRGAADGWHGQLSNLQDLDTQTAVTNTHGQSRPHRVNQ